MKLDLFDDMPDTSAELLRADIYAELSDDNDSPQETQTSPLPSHTPLAMAFVPFQQWGRTFEEKEEILEEDTELMQLLGKTDLLEPRGPEFIAGGMCGTKAKIVGADALFSEDLYAYRYDFPEMTVTINGEPVADYGRQNDTFTEADYGTMGYSAFYGGDDGEITFHTEKAGAGNLLIIGESFDNALLKLLASSYENTCSVDLRNYERENGKTFSFSDYVAEHGITDVLLIGNVDFFVLEDFRLEAAP